ncbi:hypothetical protein IE077_003089 [Cardiosporidium cionae]|uniref:GATOR2 complex protein MIO zinc-ribbon like domain-containing protein n=1 Tax=Cardiosporidium cionae TaxID=476202 RepID=A0ABQ7J9B8_9APIC|nr:hypothetical protein IE077_003089 [Cardiosporidium cionae]|eukprot:KAF8820529.1 hypothetical protein IE077_003089 [Cardiosporidium cionae]
MLTSSSPTKLNVYTLSIFSMAPASCNTNPPPILLRSNPHAPLRLFISTYSEGAAVVFGVVQSISNNEPENLQWLWKFTLHSSPPPSSSLFLRTGYVHCLPERSLQSIPLHVVDCVWCPLPLCSQQCLLGLNNGAYLLDFTGESGSAELHASFSAGNVGQLPIGYLGNDLRFPNPVVTPDPATLVSLAWNTYVPSWIAIGWEKHVALYEYPRRDEKALHSFQGYPSSPLLNPDEQAEKKSNVPTQANIQVTVNTAQDPSFPAKAIDLNAIEKGPNVSLCFEVAPFSILPPPPNEEVHIAYNRSRLRLSISPGSQTLSSSETVSKEVKPSQSFLSPVSCKFLTANELIVGWYVQNSFPTCGVFCIYDLRSKNLPSAQMLVIPTYTPFGIDMNPLDNTIFSSFGMIEKSPRFDMDNDAEAGRENILLLETTDAIAHMPAESIVKDTTLIRGTTESSGDEELNAQGIIEIREVTKLAVAFRSVRTQHPVIASTVWCPTKRLTLAEVSHSLYRRPVKADLSLNFAHLFVFAGVEHTQAVQSLLFPVKNISPLDTFQMLDTYNGIPPTLQACCWFGGMLRAADGFISSPGLLCFYSNKLLAIEWECLQFGPSPAKFNPAGGQSYFLQAEKRSPIIVSPPSLNSLSVASTPHFGKMLDGIPMETSSLHEIHPHSPSSTSLLLSWDLGLFKSIAIHPQKRQQMLEDMEFHYVSFSQKEGMKLNLLILQYSPYLHNSTEERLFHSATRLFCAAELWEWIAHIMQEIPIASPSLTTSIQEETIFEKSIYKQIFNALPPQPLHSPIQRIQKIGAFQWLGVCDILASHPKEILHSTTGAETKADSIQAYFGSEDTLGESNLSPDSFILNQGLTGEKSPTIATKSPFPVSSEKSFLRDFPSLLEDEAASSSIFMDSPETYYQELLTQELLKVMWHAIVYLRYDMLFEFPNLLKKLFLAVPKMAQEDTLLEKHLSIFFVTVGTLLMKLSLMPEPFPPEEWKQLYRLSDPTSPAMHLSTALSHPLALELASVLKLFFSERDTLLAFSLPTWFCYSFGGLLRLSVNFLNLVIAHTFAALSTPSHLPTGGSFPPVNRFSSPPSFVSFASSPVASVHPLGPLRNSSGGVPLLAATSSQPSPSLFLRSGMRPPMPSMTGSADIFPESPSLEGGSHDEVKMGQPRGTDPQELFQQHLLHLLKAPPKDCIPSLFSESSQTPFSSLPSPAQLPPSLSPIKASETSPMPEKALHGSRLIPSAAYPLAISPPSALSTLSLGTRPASSSFLKPSRGTLEPPPLPGRASAPPFQGKVASPSYEIASRLSLPLYVPLRAGMALALRFLSSSYLVAYIRECIHQSISEGCIDALSLVGLGEWEAIDPAATEAAIVHPIASEGIATVVSATEPSGFLEPQGFPAYIFAASPEKGMKSTIQRERGRIPQGGNKAATHFKASPSLASPKEAERYGVAASTRTGRHLSAEMEAKIHQWMCRLFNGPVAANLLLHQFLDYTGDIQTLALLACYGSALRAPSILYKSFRLYKDVLDRWNLLEYNGHLHIIASHYKGIANWCPIPPMDRICCYYCNAPLFGNDKLVSNFEEELTFACPKCGADLPNCVICLSYLCIPGGRHTYNRNKPNWLTNYNKPSGLPSGIERRGDSQTSRFSLKDEDKSEETSKLIDVPLNKWYTFCLKCHHGGCYSHLEEWFQQFDECPVPDCTCFCSATDPLD